MKIAIDVGPLTSGDKIRGVGAYTRELVQTFNEISKQKKTFKVEFLSLESIKEKAGNFDIIHIPYFNPFLLTVPQKKDVIKTEKAKQIISIHDVIPLLYPKFYPPGIRGRIRFAKQKRRLKEVDAIITDSETSKKDIVRLLGVPQEKIYPVYLAPARHFRKVAVDSKLLMTRKKFKLPKKFVLYVGDINYNKNIPTLIKACRLAKTFLVIVGKQALDIGDNGFNIASLQGPRDWLRYLFGKPHPEMAHYQKLQRLMNSQKVVCTGFVLPEELVAIYNLAQVYCQPSFYEGFGLPVLESMACGTPVVAAKTQALVEIAEGAALFANPKEPKDFAREILKVVESGELREKLIKDGFSLVKKYTWRKTVEETLGVYNTILNGA